jgi:hypothetical protein
MIVRWALALPAWLLRRYAITEPAEVHGRTAPAAAFWYLVGWMVLAFLVLVTTARGAVTAQP